MIFLWRRNKLRHFVSKLANKKVTAQPKDGKLLEKVHAYLPKLPVGEDFEEQIKIRVDEEAEAEKQYRQFDSIHVHYEDIVASNPTCQATWSRIQEFLCLEPRTLHMDFPAIHQFEKLEDTISNWDKVKDYIMSTRKPEYISWLQDAGGGSASNPACGG